MSLDSLDARLERVIFHKPNKFNPSGLPFLIAKTTAGATVKGEMRKPVLGESYRFWGEWKTQKGYAEPAFEFVQVESLVDEQSPNGVTQYLAAHVDGLGPAKSRAIVEHFGADTLRVLRSTPELAAQVAGITPAVVESITRHFAENKRYDPVAYAALLEMFAGHKFPKVIAKKLLETWGSQAPQAVRENPYLLLAYPRMGWKGVDGFATTTAGYDPRGVERHAAAIREAIEQYCADGHTYAGRVDVESIAFRLIDGRPSEAGWSLAESCDQIVECGADQYGSPLYTFPALDQAERDVAARIARLLGESTSLPTLGAAGLNAGQASAVELIESHNVVIIAGAPGTGKTYAITKALGELLRNNVTSIRVAAPTGKAAKRVTELLERNLGPENAKKIPCSTIHRLLAPAPAETANGPSTANAKHGRDREAFTFGRNESNPIETSVLVIDETSMVDVRLGAHLLRAIAPGTRLILVGDPNQLPSVGPGSVLRDLLDAGVPSVTLTEIQRNSGRIVRACHAIKDGQIPLPSVKLDLEAGENWLHIELSDPQQIAQQIVDLHRPYKAFPDPTWDMQVVTPQRSKLPIACDNLNRMLSQKLNTYGNVVGEESSYEDDGYTPAFRRGDKVVRTKNGLCQLMTRVDSEAEAEGPTWNWNGEKYELADTDIVNGDMGEVRDIVETSSNSYVIVQFRTPDRLCRLKYGDCNLVAAYALTCHKAQGSGFPYVVVPVHESFYWNPRTNTGIFNREWIYTAFSRAEKMLVTVGQFAAIEAAVGRKTVHHRHTRLVELLENQLETAGAVK